VKAVRARLVLLAAAAAATLVVPAAARSLFGMRLADPVWLVTPAQDEGAELTVRIDEWVTRTPLRPGGLTQLADNAVLPDGRVAAAAGETLFLRIIGGPAWCTTSSRKPGAGAPGKLSSANSDPCFFDRDGDGRFEETVRIRMMPGTSIFGAAPLHTDVDQIRPVAYRKLELTDTKRPFWIGVKFSGVYITGKPHFTLHYGVEGYEMALGRSMTLARQGKIEIFGATYTVLSHEKKVVRVRVEKAIPGQTFQLTTGVI
jgi:hypothetical protein